MATSPISDAIKQGLAQLGSADAQAAGQGAIFIGVPQGSQTETRLSGQATSFHAASLFGRSGSFSGAPTFSPYKTGTELDQLSGYSTDDIYALQLRLYNAGMLDDFIPGKVDSATRNAFKELLGIANASGASWFNTLDQISAQASAMGGRAGRSGSSAKPPPLQIQLTSPDDLKAVAQKVAQTLYGGNLPQADLDRFVATYNQMESDAQTADYNQKYSATGYGPGGTVTAPPNAATEIEKEVRAAHPEQVAATQFGNAMDTILGTFTGTRAR